MKFNRLQKRESFFLTTLIVASMTACNVEPGDDEEPGDPAEMSAEEVAEQRADAELIESVGTAEQALSVNTVTDAPSTNGSSSAAIRVPSSTPARGCGCSNDGAANDNMVYCTRIKGVNLTWAKDCTVIPHAGRLRTEDYPL